MSAQKKKIEELIDSLKQLDLVRHPKNEAAVAELKKAITDLEEIRDINRESNFDINDSVTSEFIARVHLKYPGIAHDPNNKDLTLFLRKIKHPDVVEPPNRFEALPKNTKPPHGKM